MAAGLATLERLDADAYQRLRERTSLLARGLREAAAGLPVEVASEPGLVTVFFSERPVRDFATASGCDTAAFARFWGALLERGIYAPPSQFEAWFVSLAHDAAAIERTVDAAAEALAEALR